MDKTLIKMGVIVIIVLVSLVTLLIGASIFYPTGSVIEKDLSNSSETANPFCGNGVCEVSENCDTCPADCSCVQLKLSKDIEYSQMLVWCSARIRYAAVNSGNSEAKDVRLEARSTAPHLDALRERKEVYLGDFPVNMSPVMGEIILGYDCSDDIVKISMKLYDSEGNEFVQEAEKRRG